MRITTRLIAGFVMTMFVPLIVGVACVRILPRHPELMSTIFVPITLFLIIVAIFLSIWIYWGIFKPLRELQKATRAIRDGNLDYEMEIDDLGRDEIGELCEDFNEMRLRLKASQEEKIQADRENREMISNISHDLKTPITAIKGYVEGIQDGVASSPEMLDKYVRTIYNKANDMDRLIDELTFYSKIDTNRVPYTFVRLKAREYFDDCSQEIGLDLDAQGIYVVYRNYVDEGVEIIADVEQLKRVINNIISNSVKYMDKDTKIIWFTVSDAGDFVQVDIRDNGQGVEAKDLTKIFERFYRTDASRNSSKGGSGIGLSIVKKIIEDHGGRIWATGAKDEGLTMHFILRKYMEVINE
mgnify:CR=1 FL=1